MITVPSIALFGMLIPLLSTIGQGIGWLPAVIAVYIYSMVPIVRNTYTALVGLDGIVKLTASNRLESSP